MIVLARDGARTLFAVDSHGNDLRSKHRFVLPCQKSILETRGLECGCRVASGGLPIDLKKIGDLPVWVDFNVIGLSRIGNHLPHYIRVLGDLQSPFEVRRRRVLDEHRSTCKVNDVFHTFYRNTEMPRKVNNSTLV